MEKSLKKSPDDTGWPNTSDLVDRWIKLREIEKECAEERRLLEDRLLELEDIDPASVGTERIGPLIITLKSNYKIDADLAIETAEESNMQSLLPKLFRWKPEINKKEWKSASPTVTSLFEKAVSVKVGRPSFSIKGK